MSEPTLGELVRRVEDIARLQQQMLSDLRRDRDEWANTFVRKDVYESGIKRDVELLNSRLDKQDSFRKQIITGVSVGAIMLMINLMFAISNRLALGGG